ncbi:poly(R)-hydroxyalkanoic acid synthase subunit PhaE [Desulfomonile tiedjei]|uniref:Poly(3-hydroxyalkanoate) polymerase subunit PhaE n=1 Tax=Desulfomonile tiedjei (strain ATCC 49306 / DSM 6799 / DCB-1) TaxID=706587 RepID=I4CCB5_DESTA|nr:poly(R)-hydroxyalkanoic acid synthase subunit PhaE [Desulfomonile tiedjei]AFM27206.1 Poly(R)-hydroxyalkanoic acid synthase subunit (PHA_synth_III_E) [Desulfomonile tiedjei DSM 6799]
MEKQHETVGAKSLMELWLKTSTDFWTSMTESDPNGSQRQQPDTGESQEKGRAEEALQSTMRAVKAFAASMAEPEAAESWAKGINTLPEVFIKMTQPVANSFFLAQQEWMKKAGRVGQCASEHRLNDISGTSFRVLTEVYEREFRHFFHIPQVGLARGYQEHFNAAVDRYNLFQTSLTEFLSLLYLPLEQSLKMMQDKLAEMTDSGKLPDDSKEYYRMWIKILENHYATLFKSPEYLETLRKTLDSVNEFIIARSQILQDTLKVLPVPSQQEMDELYKEIYLLKKKIRNLEKLIPELSNSQK